MTIKICRRCRLRTDCELRKERLASVKGLHLTQINFRCSKKRDDLPPGTVCVAKLPYTWDGVSECVVGRDIKPGEIQVIVRRWIDDRVLVTAEPGQCQFMVSASHEAITNAKLWPDLLTPTGKTVAVTPCCNWPIHIPQPKEIWCRTCDGEEY